MPHTHITSPDIPAAADLRTFFDQAKPYDAYVSSAKPHEQSAWTAVRDRLTLTPAQLALLQSFTRHLNILVLSGSWCGDCSAQVPMLDALAKAAPSNLVSLRILDRDAPPGDNQALAERVKICGGLRVPTVLFLNEDFDFLVLMGDQTLSRLRAKARTQLGATAAGAACDLPSASTAKTSINAANDEIATLQDWLDALERAHLTARLSPKLRQRHGD
ncbi:MAG: thioredoxin family protein [Phycisphaerales bacterium]|nr:MAG: thioredoxin family protein [Phycisphaerales bacterium]